MDQPEMKPFWIANARVLDPGQDRDWKIGSVLVEKGKISRAVEGPHKPDGKSTIDGTGKWLVPGLIDAHVHLREPGEEYKETIATGSKAALAGGFTSVACMANTNPVNDNPYVTSFIVEKAKQTAGCKVYPIGAISKGLKGEALSEIGSMVEAGAVAISDDGMPVMNSYLMRKAMDYAKAFGIPVINHSEDLNLVGRGVINEGRLSNELGLRGNPATAEEIMVLRDIALCRLTRCPIHIAHVTTALAAQAIRRAKEEGLPITAEVTPHHLMLTDACTKTYDTSFKMAPPLRTEEDAFFLREALQDGTIDLIATDHAPHGQEDKDLEFDHACCGVLGSESAVPITLALVRKGTVSLKRWLESMTSAPAKLLRLDGGTMKPGAPADLTLIDPETQWTFTESHIVSKSRNSPFLGSNLQGQIEKTFVDGEVAYERS